MCRLMRHSAAALSKAHSSWRLDPNARCSAVSLLSSTASSGTHAAITYAHRWNFRASAVYVREHVPMQAGVNVRFVSTVSIMRAIWSSDQ